MGYSLSALWYCTHLAGEFSPSPKTHLVLQYSQDCILHISGCLLCPDFTKNLSKATISSLSLLARYLTQDFFQTGECLKDIHLFSTSLCLQWCQFCFRLLVQLFLLPCFVLCYRTCVLRGPFSSALHKHFSASSGRPCNFMPVQVPLTSACVLPSHAVCAEMLWYIVVTKNC